MTVVADMKTPNEDRSWQGAIDCDVHHFVSSYDVLLPYLDEPWRGYLAHEWRVMSHGMGGHAYVHPSGADRMDARPASGGPAGSDYALMREQLIDRYDLEYAILTDTLQPSVEPVQPQFQVALASAINDWQIEHWLPQDERLRASIHIFEGDPEAAAAEIERLAGNPKLVQVMLTLGRREVSTERHHVIFEAAARHSLPVAMHVTRSSGIVAEHYAAWHSCVAAVAMSHVASFVFNGVFSKFPSLKLIMLESGWAWVPSLMWRMDADWRRLRSEGVHLDSLPSDLVRSNVRAGTQPMVMPDEPRHLTRMLEMIGSDEFLLFSTDYPHWDFDDPSRAFPSAFPRELTRKILSENARSVYGNRLCAAPTTGRGA
jgi:uncharacterized protein